MDAFTFGFVVLAGAVVLGLGLVLWAIGAFNKLVRLRTLAQEGWSGIGVQLTRRYDLIPNLVETVKGYASHEQATLEKVIAARNSAQQAVTPGQKAEAETQLAAGLRQIFALAENYPELKANQNFMHLQTALAGLEDELQLSRRYYNGAVREYNGYMGSFPALLLAGRFGHVPMEFFEAPEGAQQTPKVSF